jgi:hypothetical protein
MHLDLESISWTSDPSVPSWSYENFVVDFVTCASLEWHGRSSQSALLNTELRPTQRFPSVVFSAYRNVICQPD